MSRAFEGSKRNIIQLATWICGKGLMILPEDEQKQKTKAYKSHGHEVHKCISLTSWVFLFNPSGDSWTISRWVVDDPPDETLRNVLSSNRVGMLQGCCSLWVCPVIHLSHPIHHRNPAFRIPKSWNSNLGAIETLDTWHLERKNNGGTSRWGQFDMSHALQ